MQDVIGIPRPAWPPGITPEDCIIHAQQQAQSETQNQNDDAQVQEEIALSQSQPLPSQENPVQAANEGHIVQDEELEEEEPSLRRSERIKQIIFNKPPSPGPGLKASDAIEV